MSSAAATIRIPGLSDEQLKKRNNVLQLIKSLLNSAQGDLNLDQLEKDYHQMVDEAIPYRDLHHATLASLLQSAPEIVQVINRGGTLFVRTSKTAKDHIACLVAGQKKVAKKPTSRSKSPKFHNGAPKNTFAPGSMRRPNKVPLLPNPHVRTGGSGGFGPNGRGGKFFRPTGGRPQQRRPLLGFDSKPLVVNPANVNLNPQRRPTIPQRQPIGPHQDVMWLRNNTAVSTITTPVVNAPAISTTNEPSSNTSSAKGVVSNSRPPLIQQKPPSQQQQQHQQLKTRPQLKSPPRQILANQNNINNNNFNNNLNNKKFYISNNMQIPRAQRSTTHNFPPYCEVPPRFTKNKGAGPKGPKQQLEELAKGMGYKNLIFRSVPFGKNWLATLEMEGKRYTSFPEERSCVEEAEALVADKALKELLAIKKAAESYPVTKDCDTCLSRVTQLVSGEAHGVWFSHLRERYQVSHKENLPFDFCETASDREEKQGDTGIIFTRHENLWILSKKQDTKSSDDSSSYPQEQPLSLPVPLHNNFQTFNQYQPQSLPYMDQQQSPPQCTGYPQSLPNVVHQPKSLPYLQTQQSTSPQPQSLPFVSTAQPAAGGASNQARRPTAPLYQAPRPTLVVGMPQTSPPSANLSMSPPVSHCSPVNSFSPPSTPQSPLVRGLESADIVLPRQFSSPAHHQIILPGQLSPTYQPTSPVPLPYFSPADSVKSSSGGCSSLSLDSSAAADSSADLMSSLTLTGDRVITQDDERPGEEEEEEEIVLGDVPQPPILKLPDDDQWDVYVSHITEDNRVCFRLLCDIFNEKYEELMTEMELHYYEKKSCTSPDQIKLGHYYVLHHEETWFRVLISKVTESTVTALFVDHGDTEEVSRENVYELLPKFMELPCQYVLAGLAGLDGLVCDALTTGLQTSVLGQSLVAQVTQRCPALQVILIDTSSDEDVNINEKMLELLPDSYTKPQLPQVGGIAEVFLTYVREDGHLFVTVESETYNMLEHMLNAAKLKAEELTSGDGGGTDPTEIEMTKLYLARFPSDSDWHRARPKTPGRLAVTSPLHKALFECIDWGSEETVPLTQVLNLHSLSPTLNTLPPQALECVLANVPPQNSGLKWTPRATKRLEELQPQVGPVLLKTVSTSCSGVAEVLLFKRLQPKNELISINETLAMDSDLFAPCSSDNTNTASVQLSPRGGAAEGSVPPTPILSPPELPSVGAIFDVYVTYAANPDNFAVQSCERYPELEQLRRDMQHHYSSDGSAKQDALQPDDLVEGGFYAALHTDSYWYRVRVSSVMRGADMICGMFVDFGDCFVSSSGSMRRLLPRFSGLPHQSIRAAMAGICPINGDWMPEDTCRFRDLVQDREFVSYVMGVSLDPTLEQPTQKQTGKASANTRLLLKLVDTSQKEKDLYIDELMVSESRAQHTTTNKSDVVSEKGK